MPGPHPESESGSTGEKLIKREPLATRKVRTMATAPQRWLLIAVTAAFVVSGLSMPVGASPSTGTPSPAVDRPITLYGHTTSGWGFDATSLRNPGPSLNVDQGDVIRFQLFSQDGQPHDLVIDLDRDGVRDPGEQESNDFSSTTAPTLFNYTADTDGTFQYFCTIHGASNMRGTLTVRDVVPQTLYGSTTDGWGDSAGSIASPGPSFTVDQGDLIRFRLFAQDSQPHTLVIDLNRNGDKEAGENESLQFTSPTTAILFDYAANTPGTFQYYCGLHGAGVMRGTFTVSGGTPPTSDNTLLIVGGVVAVVAIATGAAAMILRKRSKAPPPPKPPGA